MGGPGAGPATTCSPSAAAAALHRRRSVDAPREHAYDRPLILTVLFCARRTKNLSCAHTQWCGVWLRALRKRQLLTLRCVANSAPCGARCCTRPRALRTATMRLPRTRRARRPASRRMAPRDSPPWRTAGSAASSRPSATLPGPAVATSCCCAAREACGGPGGPWAGGAAALMAAASLAWGS